MRNKSLLLLVLPFFFLASVPNVNASAPGYEIKVTINGLKDSLCYLANYYGDKQYLRDSAKLDESGHLVFKGKEDLQQGIYLFVFPNKSYFELLIDHQQAFSMETTMTDPVGSMKIKGSEDNSLFYQYLNFIQGKSKEVEPLKAQRKQKSDAKLSTDSLDKQIKAIDESVTNYKKQFIKDNQGKLLAVVFAASEDTDIPEAPTLENGKKDSLFVYHYYKAHYLDNIDLSDERILRTPIYNSKVSYYLKNLVVQIPDSIIPETRMLVEKAKKNKETFKYMVWYLTNTYETSNIMGMDAVFVDLVKNYYTKELAYWVDEATLYKIQDRAKVLEPILIGKQVKNLVLADSNEVFQSLYNVKSKITILYFWDPDCGHCKKATPKVKAYYDKVKSKGVQVYAACTEVEMEKWKKYIRENNLDWINVADPKIQNNFRHEFDVLTTPQIFILDKDKKIIAKKIDEETMEKIVDHELDPKSEVKF